MGNRISQVFIEENRFPVGWRFRNHAHAGSHELQFVLSGRIATDFSGERVVADPGSVVLHPQGRDHAEAVVGGQPLSAIYASWAGGPPVRALLVQDRHGRIEQALRWGADACARGTPAGRECAAALLLAALHEMGAVEAGPHDDLVRRALVHARANLRRPLRLPELARAAGASRAHFARAFRVATGESPMRSVRRLRIDAAKHLLATTSLSVAAIAERVGFNDRFHFSRAFSRECGRPPGRSR
jgi:AraC-like DNA-binding protein